MIKITQELYERIYGSIGGDNVTEEYQILLELLTMFSDDKKELDYEVIEKDFLHHLSMNELDLDFAYTFNKKIKLNADEKIDEIVKLHGNTKTIASYIGLNHLEDDEIVSLSVRAIKKALPENEEDVEILNSLKRYLEEKNLYFDAISAIKSSGDPETLVCSALLFEPSLINEVFGGKKNMFLYLTANTFTDNEDIEYYKERLLSMDDRELDQQIHKSAQKIDAKIKGKKLNPDIV